jgi:SH3 domain protein
VKRITALILGLLVLYPAVAEKRYVKDVLTINLRSGPGDEYKVIKGLKSGSHLQLIEESEDGNYSRITTDKGLEGWALTRYLVNEPVAFEKLILTQRELAKAKSDLTDVKNKYTSTKKELSDANRSASGLSKDKSTQAKELAYIKKVSANAINLDKKNQELMTKNLDLKNSVDVLRAENERLQGNKDLNYILMGGFLVALGLFLGWLIPKLGGRKGDAWAS